MNPHSREGFSFCKSDTRSKRANRNVNPTKLNQFMNKTIRRKEVKKARPLPRTFRREDSVPKYNVPELALILSLVYMGAALPPEPALRAGLADYIHGFSKQGPVPV
jgi:hypothetical protein